MKQWPTIRTVSELHIISGTIQVHDPYDSYDLCGSRNNGLLVVQFMNCISLGDLECIYKSMTRTARTTRTGRETMAYESYSLSTAYHQRDLGCIYKSTTRTSRSSRVTMVYESFGWCFAYQSDLVSSTSPRPVLPERVVKQWFSCRIV